MKAIIPIFIVVLLAACSGKQEQASQTKEIQSTQKQAPQVERVATFKGQQVTGVTVSNEGRIFANFPRWRKGVKHSVVEINPKDGSLQPYPNAEMNQWGAERELSDDLFIAVQSVVAFENTLYVLDTRNPFFQGVQGAPRLFAFDLTSNALERVYLLSESTYKPNSYINDLRVDKKAGKIYFTDSGAAGLVVLDIESGECRRILDNHKSTLAETDGLTINGKRWKNTVHSDGIALDTVHDQLYFHSLTGYSLYNVPTKILSEADTVIEKSVHWVSKTAAPDGMIFDNNGNLYFADLENHKIQYLQPNGGIMTLVEGDAIKWADTFSIHDGYLYFTNSRIHEAGGDVSALEFSVERVLL